MGIIQINPTAERPAGPAASGLPPLRPSITKTTLLVRTLRGLRIHRTIAALVALSVLLAGGAFLKRHKLTYASTSTIYVSPTFPKTLTADHETEYPYESYIQQQVHSVTRYDVIADAIRSLPEGVWQRPGESEQSAVVRLQHSLDVKRVDVTYQISIALLGSNPDHLAEIVNAVTQSYITKTKHEEFFGRDERLATLRQTRDATLAELDAKLQEQSSITRTLGVAVIGGEDTANPYDGKLARIQTDLSNSHEQRIEAEAQLSALAEGDSSSPNSALSAEADAVIATDPQLLALRTSLGQKRSQLVEQIAGLTPSNPLRKQSEATLVLIDTSLNELQTTLRRKAGIQLQQKLRSNLRRTATVEAQLQSDLQSSTASANTAAPRFQRAGQLKADVDRLQLRYTQLDNRINDLELESSSPGSVHLFSAAMTPISAEKSKVPLALALLLPIALLCGAGTALIIDLLDPRIYTGEDVQDVLGFAPIGALFAEGEVTQSVSDEYVLRLAAAVDHATRISSVRTFALTPCCAGDPASAIIENLAHALAGLGRKVITIDACGETNPIAYATINSTDSAMSSTALKPRFEPGIETAGVRAQPLPNRIAPVTSFVSEAFQSLMKDFDIVLIDTAPLLSSAETEYIARCVDVTLLVASAGKTTKAEFARAARLLERIDVPGTAAMVSQVKLLRVDAAVRKDVHDFTSRTDTRNIRWKPSYRPMESPSATFSEAAQEQTVPQEVS